MRNREFIALTILFSFQISAAFTQPEMTQLREINEKYIKEEIDARKNLELALNEAIANLPKEKSNILKLHELWGKTTKIKCRLAILDSLNTDAETANKYECLANEYTAEAHFLNSTY